MHVPIIVPQRAAQSVSIMSLCQSALSVLPTVSAEERDRDSSSLAAISSGFNRAMDQWIKTGSNLMSSNQVKDEMGETVGGRLTKIMQKPFCTSDRSSTQQHICNETGTERMCAWPQWCMSCVGGFGARIKSLSY